MELQEYQPFHTMQIPTQAALLAAQSFAAPGKALQPGAAGSRVQKIWAALDSPSM